jgi:hypothetical protein
MKNIALAGLVLLLGLSACGSKEASFQYQFTVDGCDTGTQVFPTLEEMCAGLESASRNGSCALSARQTFFQQKCTGTFAETP